jgi:DNA processing protein
MDEKSALIGLNMVPGLGSVRIKRLITRFGSAKNVFKGTPNELKMVDGIGPEITRSIIYFDEIYSVEAELENARKKNISIFTADEAEYPANLKKIFDPPSVLYVAGDISSLAPSAFNLGIVGTRMSSDYGWQAVNKILDGIISTKLSFNIVSGMARGIDTIAHTGAAARSIFTTAVLGFGLDYIWPFVKNYTANKILSCGVIVSEFPMGMPPLKQNFPRRNRVISGISDALLVVEAGERSGALITADCALEQGRDIFAVPGSIVSPKSEGTNWLIKQGAKPATSIYDITDEYSVIAAPPPEKKPAGPPPGLDDDEMKIYSVLSNEKKHIDNIAIESNMEVVKLAGKLTMMELKGAVRQTGGKCFIRAL